MIKVAHITSSRQVSLIDMLWKRFMRISYYPAGNLKIQFMTLLCSMMFSNNAKFTKYVAVIIPERVRIHRCQNQSHRWFSHLPKPTKIEYVSWKLNLINFNIMKYFFIKLFSIYNITCFFCVWDVPASF